MVAAGSDGTVFLSVVKCRAVYGTFGLWGKEGAVFNACSVHISIFSCTYTPSLPCCLEGGGISAPWALLYGSEGFRLWLQALVVSWLWFSEVQKSSPPRCACPPLTPDLLLHGGILLKRWWIWNCLNCSLSGEKRCHSHGDGCKSWVEFKVCQAVIQKRAGSGRKNSS